jgi:hypothetical protein
VTLGAGEHFFTFRHEVKAQLEAQLQALQAARSTETESSLSADAKAFAKVN